MRAMFCATTLFVANVGNLVIAPPLIGGLSDWFGPGHVSNPESLRLAMLCVAPLGFWATAHYFWSIRDIVATRSGRPACRGALALPAPADPAARCPGRRPRRRGACRRIAANGFRPSALGSFSVKTLQHYIAGRWVAPAGDTGRFAVINPATEAQVAEILLAGAADADQAVAAAHRAFPGYAALPVATRIALMERLLAAYERRYAEMVDAITTEMGAPRDLASRSQAAAGAGHIRESIAAALALDWEVRTRGRAAVVREPVGVCGLITPWNWPMNQIGAKVAPALVAGCTVVLKPSEQAPLSAQLFAELVDEAGFPAGAFNMVQGTGPVVGHALAAHPDIDMMASPISLHVRSSAIREAASASERKASTISLRAVIQRQGQEHAGILPGGVARLRHLALHQLRVIDAGIRICSTGCCSR